jgi:hypothetical protein
MNIWYILFSFGTFFLVLVSCTKKIWQPCHRYANTGGNQVFKIDKNVSRYFLSYWLSQIEKNTYVFFKYQCVTSRVHVHTTEDWRLPRASWVRIPKPVIECSVKV